MKIFRKLASALMVLPVVAALTACSDDDGKYTPAEKLTTAQVYFSNQLPAKVALVAEGEGVVNVTLNRIKTDEALTVNLVATQPEEQAVQFNVPASVTFSEGENTAEIKVTYDPAQVAYDTNYKCSIAISDEEYTTPYGATSYTFSASLVAPWTPFVSTAADFAAAGGQGEFPLGNEGKGTYSYVIMGTYDSEGLSVSMRQSKLNPDEVQFKVAEWGKDWFTDEGVDLVMNGVWDEENGFYRIDVPFTFTGYVHSSYGNVYTADVITYGAWRTANGASGWDVTWEEAPSYYDPKTGKFSLQMVDFVSAGSFGNNYEYLQMDGFYIPDYTAEANFIGTMKTVSGEHQAVVDFTLAVDVASAKYALTTADNAEAAVAYALAQGTLEGTEITESGRVYIPLEEDGKYRVTVVTFDAEGEAQDYTSVTFEFEKGGSSWESLGVGLWTEDLMTLLYSQDGQTPLEPEYYEVEIFASQKAPGIYRVENPYGDWGTLLNDYIEVNAEDPDHVYIEYQELFDDDGVIGIQSYGAYFLSQGYSTAVIDANMSGCFGKLEDGVISGWGTKRFYAYVDGEIYNFGNGNGAFEIMLPEAYENLEVKAKVAARKAAAKKKAAKATRAAKNKNAKRQVIKVTNKVNNNMKPTKELSKPTLLRK